MHKTVLIKMTFIALILVFLGCDQDPFRLNRRKVAGIYFLQRWEDGKIYYLEAKNGEHTGGGVLNGTVTLIGWNENYIIAKRHSIFRGDPDGWMIINVQQQSIEGPLSDENIKTRMETKGMHFIMPEEAWKKL